jgi:hypothetical protein
MSTKERGKILVVLVVASHLADQVWNLGVSLRWLPASSLEAAMRAYLDAPAAEPDSLLIAGIDLLGMSALSWLLYSGYRWTWWLFVLGNVVAVGVLIYFAPAIASFGLAELLVRLASCVVCLLAIFAPSTRSFLRRTREASYGPADA